MSGLNLHYNRERIARVLADLQAGKHQKRDVIANRASTSFNVIDGQFTLGLDMPGSGRELFSVNPTALQQIGSALDVPLPFLKGLVGSANADLAGDLLNGLQERSPRRHLYRFMGSRLRAFLSDRYRDVDNFEIAGLLASMAQEQGWSVWDLRYADDGGHFECVLVDPRAEIELGGDAPAHHNVRRMAQVYPTCRIRNSETGKGLAEVSWGFIDKLCANGFVGGALRGTRHTGQKLADGIVEWQDDTRRAWYDSFRLELRDVVMNAMDPDKLCERLAPVEEVMNAKLAEPAIVVERLGQFGLSEARGEALMALMVQVGHPMRTLWDLQWGITAMANPEHGAQLDPFTVAELEELGGRVMLDPKVHEAVLARGD